VDVKRRSVQSHRHRSLQNAGSKPMSKGETLIGAVHVDFIAVPVRDLQRADDFYGKTLGLPRSPHSSARWVEFDLDNVTLALISPEAMGPKFLDDFQPNKVPIAFRVQNVEATKQELEAAGVEFRGETIDSGVCQIAGFRDPDGNALILHRRYAPYPDDSTP
jgi:catechol 2,3-dioxygenase-like lactoylglutathione lyase family enzyme